MLSSHLITFKPGTSIIRQGRKDTNLFVVLKGMVRITRDEQRNVDIAQLKAGPIFGEISFISKRPRITNVVSSDKVMVLKIDGDLLGLVSREVQNKIKNKIIEVLIHRIEDMNKSILRQDFLNPSDNPWKI